ncbi:MAG: GNAT family N-acetyltransferase [Acidobacteria bacterium]|nr:GNAT family N-acetyltransferase [Acidobacteriota bacterium]
MKTGIRTMRATDVPPVKAVETACGLSPWSEADYEAELVRPDSITLVASVDGVLAGFIVARLITNTNHAVSDPGSIQEMEICNIGVSPFFRRRGLAASLIESAVAQLDPSIGYVVFLEVRERNTAAIKFYETIGFERTGKRKNFYSSPADDALLMAKTSV